jgi:hypothetical protein
LQVFPACFLLTIRGLLPISQANSRSRRCDGAQRLASSGWFVGHSNRLASGVRPRAEYSPPPQRDAGIRPSVALRRRLVTVNRLI